MDRATEMRLRQTANKRFRLSIGQDGLAPWCRRHEEALNDALRLGHAGTGRSGQVFVTTPAHISVADRSPEIDAEMRAAEGNHAHIDDIRSLTSASGHKMA